MKTKSSLITSPMNRSPLRRDFLLITFAGVLFALSPAARAVDPPPDGGYPHRNTAEGTDALFNLDTSQPYVSDNTATGFDALFSNTTGFGNTANGSQALYSNTTGGNTTACGIDALYFNTNGSGDIATGYTALHSKTSAYFNTANGSSALFSNTSGNTNTAIGAGALHTNEIGSNNTAAGVNALYKNTGDNNIALGVSAGFNLHTGNNNIYIGNAGNNGDHNKIRIGTVDTQKATFIAGISGVTVPAGVGVIVGTDGKLGTIVSSERFKDNIQPMDKVSEAILALKPVTFHYKHELDPDGIPQFGLVAEDVEKVNPDLVARDEKGKPYTVRYEAVNAMLLNEFLKEHRKNEKQEETIARQQKEINALSGALKEQAAHLQKVEDRLEITRPTARIVDNK